MRIVYAIVSLILSIPSPRHDSATPRVERPLLPPPPPPALTAASANKVQSELISSSDAASSSPLALALRHMPVGAAVQMASTSKSGLHAAHAIPPVAQPTNSICSQRTPEKRKWRVDIVIAEYK